MCVEDKLLSSYADGEVKEAEKAGIEAHLAQCPQCRKRYEGFLALSTLFSSSTIGKVEVENASGRVARRLDHIIMPGNERGFWNRRFSIPMPAALAALLAVMFVGSFAGLHWQGAEKGAERTAFDRNPAEAGTPLDYVEELKLLAAVSDEGSKEASIQRLFELLESGGASIEVKIELPRDSVFRVHGEPQLLRAAEFRGGGLE